ncbi:MAG: DoxX family protein [Pseudodonghicola sp.]
MLSVFRIVTAVLLLEHGTQKPLGFPPGGFSPELLSLLWIAGALELVGGSFLVLGLLTLPIALILSTQMAVAYWMADVPSGFFPIANGGESAILFCFTFLYLVFAGAGSWSLDALIPYDASQSSAPQDSCSRRYRGQGPQDAGSLQAPVTSANGRLLAKSIAFT